MVNAASILSILFFSLIFIYLFWGIEIIRLNPKSSINRVFLAFSIAMGIWSLGYSMSTSANSLETAMLWRRISAIGWTILYAIILHFFILLTNKDNKMKNKWLLVFLYVPAFINTTIFAFSTQLAQAQYNLMQFDYGWSNTKANNGWDWFFYFYYISYMAIGLVIVWKWKRRLENIKIVKKANLIIVSFCTAFILGSLVDIILGSLAKNPIPQLSPFFILFPTWAMYYSARNYGVMGQKNYKKEEIIVTDADQKIVFKNLAIAFFLGGTLSLLSGIIPFLLDDNSNLKRALLRAGFLFGMGLCLLIFQRVRKKSIKEALTIIVLVLSIPFVIFQFVYDGGLTIWAFPLVVIMSSLLFSKRTLLVSSAVMAIITQRFIWMLKPVAAVKIDQYDYMARILLILIALFIGLYVNKIYVSKIKENAIQIAFQKINSEISLEFVNINQKNLDEKMNKLLAVIGLFFQTDRIYLFLINHKDNTMSYSYEWCGEGIGPEVGTIADMSLDVFPWWIAQLKNNKLVYIENVYKMPAEASAEQEQLMRQKVKSLISVPVGGDNNLQGFLGIDSVLSYKKWTEENIKQLNILSNLISHGLAKIKDEKKIEFMAYYDRLTKLPNRFLFKDRTNQAIQLAKRNGKFVAVLFMDIDNFKAVNDTLGHMGGDYLLKKVARNLQEAVRKTDTVARFGGDEFMIMLNDIEDYQDISIIADKLMDLLSKSYHIRGQDFWITGSTGISIFPPDGDDAEMLIKHANTAMYKAKEEGKNRYFLCTSDMKKEVKTSMVLLNDLYRAIEKNQLHVYYQPQVDLSTGKINGVEALLRWIHPEKGFISPGLFIPLAEKNGLINSIGEWVLKEACRQSVEWQNLGFPHIRMAVNLSAIQLINPNIVDTVQKTLIESTLSPEYLELEITETIAIKESTYIEEVLNRLKKIGASIAIDDFGTEYSSLSRLKNLPIDRIKIDMQFIQGIENNEKDRAITMVIINLAKSLGLNVIAEGVETRVQREFLSQNLCDDVQGYYYHRPMPAEEIEKLLFNMKKTDGGSQSQP